MSAPESHQGNSFRGNFERRRGNEYLMRIPARLRRHLFACFPDEGQRMVLLQRTRKFRETLAQKAIDNLIAERQRLVDSVRATETRLQDVAAQITEISADAPLFPVSTEARGLREEIEIARSQISELRQTQEDVSERLKLAAQAHSKAGIALQKAAKLRKLAGLLFLVEVLWPFCTAYWLHYLAPHVAQAWLYLVLNFKFGLLAGIIVLLLGGLFLFGLRSRFRRIYALTEILVAVYGAWLATSSASDGGNANDVLWKVSAATYLLVRGLDNLANGHDTAMKRLLELARSERKKAKRLFGFMIS